MKKLLDRLFRRKAAEREAKLAAEEAHEDEIRRPPEDTEGEGDDDGEPWIGLDLDGTLARYDGWRGLDSIGKPIPRMVRRLETWLEAGYQVKIFTARASVPGGVEAVKAWLEKHGLPELEVTNEKDFNLVEYWDDRAVQVLANRGMAVLRPAVSSMPKAALLDDEAPDETFVREARIRPKREEEGDSATG